MTTPQIRTLHNGTIDMDYYRRQAAQARATAIRAAVRALGRWLKTRLRLQTPVATPYRLSH